MPLQVYRLRRVLAVIAVLFTVVVAGMYFYARSRARNVLKELPNKIGVDIKQTATGFQFSKSDGGRTLFTIQASNLKEFKLNGHAELHNVSIVLYGRDSSRFDQIYGDDFAYDPKTGDVTASGDVQIDLEANPSGLASPDQSAPKELKNPIHLKTRDLVFNKETGNAWTKARVEFRTPQATGSAVGVSYAGRANTLTLESQVRAELTGPNASVIEAKRGLVTRDPRQIVLDHPRMVRPAGTLEADQATFVLGQDNNVERVLAKGNVNADTKLEPKHSSANRANRHRAATAANSLDPNSPDQQPTPEMRARADEADLVLTGKQPQLETATLKGNVQVERIGFQPLQGYAERAILEFSGQNQLKKVHAEQGVRLTQQGPSAASPNANGPTAQDFELTAPIVDFLVTQGRRLDRAVTSGTSQITIASAQPPPGQLNSPPPQKTVVTAGRFEAHFQPISAGSSRLASIHGAPQAKIVNTSPDHFERISTSQTVDAAFLPQGGIESITQQGNVVYSDGQIPDKRVQAWADQARYTPADQMLNLTGSPRVTNAGMSTTATSIRMNRATGDAIANGDVKSTYSQLKEQPDGALLASSSPIHVTALTMTAHSSPALALYSGKARLWQDANIIEAPSIQFDREHRSLTAQGTDSDPVSTILLQPEKAQPQKVQPSVPQEKSSADKAKKKSGMKPEKPAIPTPIAITARQLTYVDAERKAHYDGGVVAKAADFTTSADVAEVYLTARKQASTSQSSAQPGQLDRMVAQGHVVIQQPKRRAEGQTLVYTASDDKFVLTGGPPSIFDAERGKITGVSLTFFRRDDRVLVEGEASTPVVTQTRVAQ
jgi:lipopolysaccharide export system protein LptA